MANPPSVNLLNLITHSLVNTFQVSLPQPPPSLTCFTHHKLYPSHTFSPSLIHPISGLAALARVEIHQSIRLCLCPCCEMPQSCVSANLRLRACLFISFFVYIHQFASYWPRNPNGLASQQWASTHHTQ